MQSGIDHRRRSPLERCSALALVCALLLFQLAEIAHDTQHVAGDSPQHCAACLHLDQPPVPQAAVPVPDRATFRVGEHVSLCIALPARLVVGAHRPRAPPRA